MRAAWPLAVVLLPALHALACGAPATDDVVETSSANLDAVARQESASFLDHQAAAWVEKDDWPFVQGGRCVMSCHTTVPFMMVRSLSPKTSAASSDATLARVRGLVEARVDDWTNVAPLYAWVPEDSRGTEAVLNAFALVAADAPSGTLTPIAKKALDAMWREQQPDGSFAWWDTFSLAPWENGDAGVWGAALADLTIGLAPESYLTAMTPEETAKLAALEAWLGARAADAAVPLNNRAMILLASTRRPALLSATVKAQIAGEIRQRQSADGSWSASSLGFPVAGGAAAAAGAHAYATAFFTYVLAQSGDTAAVPRGRAWLEAHRRADGAWEARSLNKPNSAFNNQQITDAATAYALLALTP